MLFHVAPWNQLSREDSVQVHQIATRLERLVPPVGVSNQRRVQDARLKAAQQAERVRPYAVVSERRRPPRGQRRERCRGQGGEERPARGCHVVYSPSRSNGAHSRVK